MSLATANLMETVKKQYSFKLKAYIDSFSSLVGIQLLAILFSLGGSSSYTSFSDGIGLEVKYYSADIVIVFTMIWAFVTAITITTKPYRNHDFTYVATRLSSSLSNILFLLTASLLGATTAVFSRFLIQLIGFFLFDYQLYSAPINLGVIALGIISSLIYIFSISSIGYLVGALVQVSKIFAVFIPVLFIGSLFLNAATQREPFLTKVVQFYAMETSVLLFLIKMLVTTALFFILSISILNRMEVRR